MSNEFDMSKTIAPKSDQLNADDLVAGTVTAKIVDVKRASGEEQPFWFFLAGFPGRPWKPCKTQRRLLVEVWGWDASKYIGRTVELQRDPRVIYGGNKVGGIRVFALSHIETEKWVVVSESKNKRTQYLVKRLDVTDNQPRQEKGEPENPPKERGNIESALSTIEKWTGDTGPLKAKLNVLEWTKEERAQIAETLKGKKANG